MEASRFQAKKILQSIEPIPIWIIRVDSLHWRKSQVFSAPSLNYYKNYVVKACVKRLFLQKGDLKDRPFRP
jgi:hypothetical protein